MVKQNRSTGYTRTLPQCKSTKGLTRTASEVVVVATRANRSAAAATTILREPIVSSNDERATIEDRFILQFAHLIKQIREYRKSTLAYHTRINQCVVEW